MKHWNAGLMALLLCGCGTGPEGSESKRINSVLQIQEYDLRHSTKRFAYRFSKNALNTEYDTIAFPLSPPERGYIVFLAKPRNDADILSIPDKSRSFTITRDILHQIATRGYITEPLEEYLATRAK